MWVNRIGLKKEREAAVRRRRGLGDRGRKPKAGRTRSGKITHYRRTLLPLMKRKSDEKNGGLQLRKGGLQKGGLQQGGRHEMEKKPEEGESGARATRLFGHPKRRGQRRREGRRPKKLVRGKPPVAWNHPWQRKRGRGRVKWGGLCENTQKGPIR